MKATQKKLVGGLLISLLIATVGAAFATGQTDNATKDANDYASDTTITQIPFRGNHLQMGPWPCTNELTDEQKTELEALMTSLRNANATKDEIRTAILEKLDEYGVLDAQLNKKINLTEQRLTILNRQKELRNEGYSWDEIKSIIGDEFGMDNATGIDYGMYGMTDGGPRNGHGPCEAPNRMTSTNDTDL